MQPELPPVENLPAQVTQLVRDLGRRDGFQPSITPGNEISFDIGSARILVKITENPPIVEVVSPLLTDVLDEDDLYKGLSEITASLPIGRLYFAAATVWASVPVFGRAFQEIHFTTAVELMAGLADSLDDVLQKRFGGRRARGDENLPPDQPRLVGMYL